MSTVIELQVEAEVDLCPICGAAGFEACVEEDGQYVLDHWGRAVEVWALELVSA